MTYSEAFGIALMLVVVLVGQGAIQEWDHYRAMQERCAMFDKDYSHSLRACVRRQR